MRTAAAQGADVLVAGSGAAGLTAALAAAAQGWWMPMVEIPGETIDGQPYHQSLIRERALPHQIVVNAAGRRFTDEALPYNEFCKAMNGRNAAGGYPNRVAWMVFDETYRRRYTFPETRPGDGIPGWVHVAGSLVGLAAATRLPADALAETVERWNRNCGAGYDPDFGRGGSGYERFMGDPGAAHPNLGPLIRPPYYAVRVRSGTIGTKGGPVTDGNARVLTQAGRPVPGLYAAGNAAAFWTADGYPGAGATLGVAMTRATSRAATRRPQL
jgi:3-oxosteroid 1-dehydrogenase